jgi:bifunctional non-homologous end joining protein LigD
MKARLVSELPTGDEWLFELKLDGIRAVAVKQGRNVRIFSRLPRELTAEYPKIVEALQRLPARDAVLDGEIAALDPKGFTSFQLLQNRRSSQSLNILFYVFDLLHLDGRDLKNVPLVQRRELLEALMAKSTGPLRISAAMQGPAPQIWKEVTRLGLEGVIAKQKNSLYESGRRSGAWIKVKTQAEQEFVIGGCTPPEGTRKYFGAILVGYYQGRDLIFASRVGTGFDHATLKSLHALFLQHRTATCPFSNLPTQRAGRFGQGVTAAEMSRCTWLKPKLVGQVRFQEWTADGSLRQPVFLGLRTDKAPEEVVRESRP